MEQYIGKMLDNRYEILECIGTGGMAVVYKARCHRLNRLVAVKILKPELASDADFRRRFHDESQAVAMLSHANIVSVYDVSRSDGLDYIVMELIDGMTLKQYMQKRGMPLNWREALHFITQIVQALGHAHSRGIIHRDIKPQNVLVLRDGSVKVTDFGIAQLASAAQSTMTQETLGSVHYISPEQARGSYVDCRTDLYSVGVVLYEMLTGRLPFEGDTPMNVAIQHINSIPIPPRELNPDIPPALEAITMKAMAHDLDQRYASADAMLLDLKEFRKNPHMTASQPPFQPDVADEPTMVVSIDKLPVHDSLGAQRRDRNEDIRGARRRQEREPEAEEPVRRGGGAVTALVATLVILLFVGGVGFFLWNFLFSPSDEPKDFVVPNVLGYTVEELEQDPTILGDFKLEVIATVQDEDYEEGQICSQSPEADSTVKKGNLFISVKVCGGEDLMYMPDVATWDSRQALSVLQDEMGLKVNQELDDSDTITEGYVISYTPQKNTRVDRGDEVTIVISTGPRVTQVTVPNFLNMPFVQVASQLETVGLRLGTTKELPSDEYAEGRVMWQSINATKEVDKDTVIDFWVSLGPVETSQPPESEPVTSEEPTATPTPEPTQTPAPTPEPPPPSEDVPDVPSTSTQNITVDLSRYTGTVNVRIVVGGTEIYNSDVDADSVDASVSRPVTASGLQTVQIYIDGSLVENYTLQF